MRGEEDTRDHSDEVREETDFVNNLNLWKRAWYVEQKGRLTGAILKSEELKAAELSVRKKKTPSQPIRSSVRRASTNKIRVSQPPQEWTKSSNTTSIPLLLRLFFSHESLCIDGLASIGSNGVAITTACSAGP